LPSRELSLALAARIATELELCSRRRAGAGPALAAPFSRPGTWAPGGGPGGWISEGGGKGLLEIKML